MTEKEFDVKVMEVLIPLYNEVAEQINEVGETVYRQYSPELIERRDRVGGYITTYAQHYFQGLAYADKMSIAEIEETIKDGIVKSKGKK